MAILSPEEWECIDRLGMNIVMMAWVMITRTVCAQCTKFFVCDVSWWIWRPKDEYLSNADKKMAEVRL